MDGWERTLKEGVKDRDVAAWTWIRNLSAARTRRVKLTTGDVVVGRDKGPGIDVGRRSGA